MERRNKNDTFITGFNDREDAGDAVLGWDDRGQFWPLA